MKRQTYIICVQLVCLFFVFFPLCALSKIANILLERLPHSVPFSETVRMNFLQKVATEIIRNMNDESFGNHANVDHTNGNSDVANSVREVSLR